MSIIDNYLLKAGILELSSMNYRISNYSGKVVFLENIKGIKSFCSEQIEVYLLKGSLKITGESMTIKKYSLQDLIILGKINSIEEIK